ncbi:hypothetical protein PG993_013482 [Apiospora rasikravindrae]|uniref:Uncharacterized protein n=1 Tax=Apiospora rasikravindrae TaxID=990691 RepID=A0ABR1RZ59_9PEZI
MKALSTIMTITTVLVGFTMGAPAAEGAAALVDRQATCENTPCGEDVFCFSNRCANGCVDGYCSHP